MKGRAEVEKVPGLEPVTDSVGLKARDKKYLEKH